MPSSINIVAHQLSCGRNPFARSYLNNTYANQTCKTNTSWPLWWVFSFSSWGHRISQRECRTCNKIQAACFTLV